MTTEKKKTCFVLSPIGDENSPIRIHADKLYDHIIKPVVEECGYSTPIRADHDPRPSMITNTIIEHLMTDDLVIAVLTGSNANVFYELATRHYLNKPCVHMVQASSQTTPFDISGMHIIRYDQGDWDSIKACKDALLKEIQSAEKGEGIVNPITSAISFQKTITSKDSSIKESAIILEQMQQMLGSMKQVESSIRHMTSRNPGLYLGDPFQPLGTKDNLYFNGSAVQAGHGTSIRIGGSESYFEPVPNAPTGTYTINESTLTEKSDNSPSSLKIENKSE